jgi:hypothetical protein
MSKQPEPSVVDCNEKTATMDIFISISEILRALAQTFRKGTKLEIPAAHARLTTTRMLCHIHGHTRRLTLLGTNVRECTYPAVAFLYALTYPAGHKCTYPAVPFPDQRLRPRNCRSSGWPPLTLAGAHANI